MRNKSSDVPPMFMTWQFSAVYRELYRGTDRCSNPMWPWSSQLEFRVSFRCVNLVCETGAKLNEDLCKIFIRGLSDLSHKLPRWPRSDRPGCAVIVPGESVACVDVSLHSRGCKERESTAAATMLSVPCGHVCSVAASEYADGSMNARFVMQFGPIQERKRCERLER